MFKVIYFALLLSVLSACAIVPEGVDPVDFRLRELQLNIQSTQQSLPIAGSSVEDEQKLNELLTKLDEGLDKIIAISSADDRIAQLESLSSALTTIVDSLNDENAVVAGRRLIGLLNLYTQSLKNQQILNKEFGIEGG